MFGFPVDNTIGGTSQPNGWMDNWIDFYRERRLQHQLNLTKDPKLQQMGEKLCANLELFFEGVEVSPQTTTHTKCVRSICWQRSACCSAQFGTAAGMWSHRMDTKSCWMFGLQNASLCVALQVKPSVLHGDLWSGNISGVDGQPSIFDPAVYYGHSEADFGMSWCAGFSSAFYDAYHKVMPKAPGKTNPQISWQQQAVVQYESTYAVNSHAHGSDSPADHP